MDTLSSIHVLAFSVYTAVTIFGNVCLFIAPIVLTIWTRRKHLSLYVWEDDMSDETDEEIELYPCATVACPVCLAEKGKLCHTTAGNVPMSIPHQSRKKRYDRYLSRYQYP